MLTDLATIIDRDHPPDLIGETPVLIQQDPWEFCTLLELFNEHQPGSILEVGVNHGGTLYQWCKNAIPGAEITAVDSNFGGNEDLFNSWKKEENILNLVEGDCSDRKIIETISKKAPFDWIFIDADHLYESVKSDWVHYRPLILRGGGVVAFHDIKEFPDVDWLQVDILWKEIQRDGYVTQELVNPNEETLGGIGIVYL